MPQVDPVILKLKADIAEYRRDLSGAQRLTDEKLGAIERRGATMSAGLSKGFTLAKTAAASFAAALGADAIFGAIKRGLDYASSLGEIAQQLGVTTNALQEYRYAATQVGLSNEEMDQALSQLTRRLGEAESGTKAQAEAFGKLGINVKGLTAGDAIPAIADAMQKIESPAERAAILMDLFGRSGQKLEPLLAGGSAAVNQLRDAAHNLGIVLSESEIQNADRTADKLSELKMVLEANIAGAVANNAQAIYGLVDALSSLINMAGRTFAVMQRLNSALNTGDNWIQRAKNIDNAINRDVQRSRISGGSSAPGAQGTPRVISGADNINAYLKSVGTTSSILGDTGRAVAALAGGGGARGGGGGGGGRALSSVVNEAAQRAEQLASEAARLDMDEIRAKMDLATSAQERADLEKQALAIERAEIIRNLEARKLLSASLLEKVNNLYGTPGTVGADGLTVDGKPGLLAQKINREFEQREAQIRNEMLAREGDVLDAWTELETNISERNKMEQVALALQQEIQRNLLEQEIATGKIADAEKARAQLASLQSAAQVKLARSQRSPRERYLDDIRESADNINDAIENIEIQGLEALNDGLVEAIMGAKSLGDVFKNVANQIIGDLLRIAIQRSITAPLAEALFGGGGGGGGGIFGAIGGALFGKGRASGGPVTRGTPYMVGESGRELFIPDRSGMIVPAGQVNAMTNGGGQAGGIATVQLVLSGDIDARIQQVSGPVAIEVVRQSAPSIIDASARETMARVNRPRI